MLFILPWEVYTRIERLIGNKQSQLLQEVKRTLLATFPNTDLAADGQVVAAPFQTYNVDIVPAFRFIRGSIEGSIPDRPYRQRRKLAIIESGR